MNYRSLYKDLSSSHKDQNNAAILHASKQHYGKYLAEKNLLSILLLDGSEQRTTKTFQEIINKKLSYSAEIKDETHEIIRKSKLINTSRTPMPLSELMHELRQKNHPKFHVAYLDFMGSFLGNKTTKHWPLQDVLEFLKYLSHDLVVLGLTFSMRSGNRGNQFYFGDAWHNAKGTTMEILENGIFKETQYKILECPVHYKYSKKCGPMMFFCYVLQKNVKINPQRDAFFPTNEDGTFIGFGPDADISVGESAREFKRLKKSD